MNKNNIREQWEDNSNQIIKYYSDLMLENGFSAEALAARDVKYTMMFFNQLFSGIKIKENSTFLDIGSGLGFFIDYIKVNKISAAEYLGIDLIQQFVDYSKIAYPSCNFIQGNFISEKFTLTKKYNYVFALGVLVSNMSNYEIYLFEFIKKMLSFSKEYVFFNLIIEIDKDSNNYQNRDKVGSITYIDENKLVKILNSFQNISYKIIKKKIFDDATDAFVQIKVLKQN